MFAVDGIGEICACRVIAAAERNLRECAFGGQNASEVWGGQRVFQVGHETAKEKSPFVPAGNDCSFVSVRVEKSLTSQKRRDQLLKVCH